MSQGASDLLAPLISERRRKRLRDIAAMRTRFVTLVLDDLYHQHNMSAVVRSAEAFGIQEIHVIQLSNPFRPSHGVALGAQQWITVRRHESVEECMESLRAMDYLVLAADPPSRADGSDGRPVFALDGIPLDRPVALVFGRERDGLHEEVRMACDASFYIPMRGFTRSLNVSVTAGICVYALRQRLEAMHQEMWTLGEDEQLVLVDEWSVKSVRRGPDVLEAVRKKKGKRKSE